MNPDSTELSSQILWRHQSEHENSNSCKRQLEKHLQPPPRNTDEPRNNYCHDSHQREATEQISSVP